MEVKNELTGKCDRFCESKARHIIVTNNILIITDFHFHKIYLPYVSCLNMLVKQWNEILVQCSSRTYLCYTLEDKVYVIILLF